MKVLIVDDDPIVIDLLTVFFCSQGFASAKGALDAQEAMKLLGREQLEFGCILLNAELDGMDTLDFCRTVRRFPSLAKIPMILLVPLNSEVSVEGALRAGATDFVLKPIDFAVLRERFLLSQIIKEPEQAQRLALMRLEESDLFTFQAKPGRNSSRVCQPSHTILEDDDAFLDQKNWFVESSERKLKASRRDDSFPNLERSRDDLERRKGLTSELAS